MKVATMFGKLIRTVAFTLAALLLLVCGMTAVLYSPWAQRMIVDTVNARFGGHDDGVRIELAGFRLLFPLRVEVDGFMMSEHGDTLMSAGRLHTSVDPLMLLSGKIGLGHTELIGGRYRLGDPDSSMYMTITADSIALDPAAVGLAAMDIGLSSGVLKGASVNMVLNPDTVQAPPSPPTRMSIALERLHLEDFTFSMRLMPGIDTLSAYIASAELRHGLVDLFNQKITLRRFGGSGLDARYIAPDSAAVAAAGPYPMPVEEVSDSTSAPWTVAIDSISFDRSRGLYAIAGVVPSPGLDFSYISVDELSLRVHDFYNRATAVRVPLEVSGRERCGVDLNVSGTLDIDSVALNFRDFALTTPSATEARFSGVLGMGDMTSDPALPLALQLDGAFGPSDLGRMFPLFMPYFAALPGDEPLLLTVDASGTTGSLDIDGLKLRANRCVALEATGTVQNIMNPEALGGHVALNGSITNVTGLKNAVFDPATAREINIPPLTLRGDVDMNAGVVSGRLSAATSGGDIRMNVRWNSRREDYNLDVATNTFPVNAFMPLAGVGAVTATVNAVGRGYDPFAAGTVMDVGLTVDRALYNDVAYTDISGSVSLADGQARVRLNSDNYDADFTLEASGNLNGDRYVWSGNLDGRNIDLHALNFSPEPCTLEINADIGADLSPRAGEYAGYILLHDLYYRRLSGTIALNDVDMHLNSTAGLTGVDVRNRDLTASFTSPCGLDTLIARFTRVSAIMAAQMADYFIDANTLGRALPPFTLDVSAGSSNLINDVLAVSGMSVLGMNLRADNDSILRMNVDVRRFATSSMVLDSIYAGIHQEDSRLLLTAGLDNRPGNMDQWHKVRLDGAVNGNVMELGLRQENLSGMTGFDIGLRVKADAADSTFTLNIHPANPVISYQQWTVNDSNFISYRVPDKHIDANLRMEGGNSSLALYTEHSELPDSVHDAGQEDLVVRLSDIHIQDWIALNPFATPMSGDVSAEMRLNRIGEVFVGKGSAGITRFIYGRKPVSDITADFNVAANGAGKIGAAANLSVDGQRVMRLRGLVNPEPADSTQTGPLQLDLSMIRFPLAAVNPFLPSGTGSLSGVLNGSLAITGTMGAPVADGYLAFDSTAVHVAMLGTDFLFSSDSIAVRDNVITFNRYAIKASNENPLTIDGNVDMRNFSDMNMDLSFGASGMQLVNSKRAARGADVYGKAFIDLDATVRGNMSMLSVDARLKLLAGTNVSYVMQMASSQLTNYSSDDVVKFVNFADSAAVAVADSLRNNRLAMFIDATLDIEEGTTIGVDLSTDGKNRVELQSNAQLTYTQTPLNTGRLTGRLNIERGFVRYSIPMILSEKLFEFRPDSYVAFTGDMMNPTVHVSAVDVVKANVTQTGQNSRLVDFDVSVSATGTLANLNVALDLSTNDDASVANELQSMSPEQRANQAMNLLLYKMYTGPGTKGDAAMSNTLYSFLASQLNNWASGAIKGVDVSFGISQYDRTVDGSTSQTMSYSYQVSKSLFNDSFKIVVGGNYSTDANADENFSQNLISDISFEYFLNKQHTMYLRLFRHTGYESILEGEITQTGVGFVYRRKLSRLGDMFLPQKNVRRRIERENEILQQMQQSPVIKEDDE